MLCGKYNLLGRKIICLVQAALYMQICLLENLIRGGKNYSIIYKKSENVYMRWFFYRIDHVNRTIWTEIQFKNYTTWTTMPIHKN